MATLSTAADGASREMAKFLCPELGISCYGVLVRTKFGAKFKGIADGLNVENQRAFTRLGELRGSASQSGPVWVSQLIFRNAEIIVDGTRPSSVEIDAGVVISGEFDPRERLVNSVSASLPLSHWLIEDRFVRSTVEHESNAIVSKAPIRNEPIVLAIADGAEVRLEYPSTIGRNVSYRERLLVHFSEPVSSDRADAILDATLLLISVITQVECRPASRDYVAETGGRVERATRRTRESNSQLRQFSDWLAWPGRIANLLGRMLPSWICSVREQQVCTMVKQFVSTIDEKGFVENTFLSYCQSFEGLNRHRTGDDRASAEIDERLTESLLEKAKELGMNSKLRRRLQKAIRDASSRTLEDRLARVFDPQPQCVVDKLVSRPNLFAEVAARRNQLSHGSAEGIVQDAEDFARLKVESVVVRVLCLAEVLKLGGLPDEDVKQLLGVDSRMKHCR